MSATRLRPHGHLFRQGLLACIAFMTPVFTVLYFMTIPDGPWPAVLATQVVATLVVTLASCGYFRAGFWVDPDGVTERGFFGLRHRVPVESIGSIVVAETFDGASTTRTRPQLFVCDNEGRQLLRLRGQFWTRESMEVVVSTLDVPYAPVTDPMSMSELRNDHPGLLYWFERHPVLAGLAFTVAAGVVGVGLFLAFRAFGAFA